MDAGGLSIGSPLRAFNGILTGAPVYRGDTTPLLNTDAASHALGQGSNGVNDE